MSATPSKPKTLTDLMMEQQQQQQFSPAGNAFGQNNMNNSFGNLF